METSLATLQFFLRTNEGEQHQYLLLRRRRKAVRDIRLQARRRYCKLMMVLSMATMATLVPRPRIQWTLQRYL